jgi:hypothetical protein
MDTLWAKQGQAKRESIKDFSGTPAALPSLDVLHDAVD